MGMLAGAQRAVASMKVNLRAESVWKSTGCLCRGDESQERLSWVIDWGANAANNSNIVILRSGNFLLWPLN